MTNDCPWCGSPNACACDHIFERELRESHKWTQHVAALFNQHGIEATPPVPVFRDNRANRSDYIDVDVVANGRRIEVKSRSLTFTAPDNLPYSDMFVYARRAWDKKLHKPSAVILVSRATGGCVAVPAKTAHLWTVRETYDRLRGYSEERYCCPSALIRPMADLIEWLKEAA